jgi:Ca2+-binding EF-hand superfamily protein
VYRDDIPDVPLYVS